MRTDDEKTAAEFFTRRRLGIHSLSILRSTSPSRYCEGDEVTAEGRVETHPDTGAGVDVRPAGRSAHHASVAVAITIHSYLVRLPG
jgi:hypothetical protein